MSNRLEDALRETFGAAVTAEPEQFAGAVRQGVRRRQQTRRAVGITAAVVVLGGGGVAGLSLRDGGDERPPLTDKVTDSNGVTPAPEGAAAFQVVGDSLYVLDDDPGCECSKVYRQRDGEWALLGRIDSWTSEQLGFTSDGSHAWASDWNGELWASDDGGHTWHELAVPGPHGSGMELAVTDDGAWVTTGHRGLLHYAPDATEPQEVTVPGIDKPLRVVSTGASLVVADPTSSPIVQVSDDAGASWQGLDSACGGGALQATAGAVFATCSTPDGVTVERWAPGSDRFEPFAQLDAGTEMDVLPLDADRLLLKDGDDERLVTADGTTDITTYVAASETLRAAGAIGDHLYLATFGGFQESLDGGKDWRPVR